MGALTVDRLTVEYAETLLGTDEPHPRLSWTSRARGHNVRQTAYQIVVAADRTVPAEGPDVWDSGVVDAPDSVDIAYTGPKLRARTRYHWQVRVWDQDGRPSGWSRPGWWETGMGAEPWSAEWIAGPVAGRSSVAEEAPAPLLRREFTVDKPVHKGRMYVTGLAYYEAELNGTRIGSQVLDPGFTHYDRTILYAVHDITDALTLGANAVGVTLGRGFYGMTTPNVWNWHRAPWHGEPRLLAQVDIEHTDGTRTTVGTDSSWRATEGPTRSNSLYAGDTFDARKQPRDWTRPGFDDRGWVAPTVHEPSAAVLRAQQHESIKVIDTVRPVAINELSAGTYVVDMGRIMAGWTRLSVRAPAGRIVRLLHGEKLRPDGSVEAANSHVYSNRHQLDEYICAGTGTETWEPKFSYKGFRYMQVSGLPARPTNDDIVGRVVRSDVAEVSTLRCSEPLFERLDQMMRRTLLNNLHGLPTDTPMYEKNGWTGDAQLGAPTMAYAFDMPRMLTKWIGDVADAQTDEGQLPVIAPSGGWGYRELAPAPEWTTVFPFLLREMYRWYDDDRPARRYWGKLTAYLDWEIGRLENDLATTALGDYLAPGYPDGNPPEDTRLSATAYLYRGLRAAAELGDRLGHSETAAHYRDVSDQCRDALNASFLDVRAGHYRTGTDPEYRQTSNALPLAFDMVPTQARQGVADSLADDVRARGNHLNTGALGTSVLLPVLTAHGYAALAHAIAVQRDYPSWGYWLEHGADTMWERWDRDARSRDHYFQGTVTQWLYENVAGLRPGDGGYRHFVVRPDGRVGLRWAHTEVRTVRGQVAVGWSCAERELHLTVEVPVGAEAEVHVPSESSNQVAVVPSSGATIVRTEPGFVVFTVGSGNWRFTGTVCP